MAAVYPGAIPTTANIPDPGANLSSPAHSTLHINTRDELLAALAELGVAPSGSSATVTARFSTLWERIGSASFSAASTVDITIPASTYRLVRITIVANVAAGTNVDFLARVNNDSTAGLHRNVSMSAFSDAVNTTADTGSTSWLIGKLSTNSGNTEVLISNADSSTACPYKASSVSPGTFTEADMRIVNVGGGLSASRAISSLRILPASSTISGWYGVEGMRP